MKKALQDWIKANPEKGVRRGKASQYEPYQQELKVLFQEGYSTKKVAQYLEDVEKVKFKKKDGENVLTSLASYLRDLAKTHGIKRRGREPKA